MSLIDQIIQFAMGAVGTPYVWGGSSSAGYDCSGLVQAAFRAAGIDLPRVSVGQSMAGTAVPIDQMQPGDILWWNYSSRNDSSGTTGADHVAIYIGGGKMIEALHPGEPVHVVSVRTPDGATRVGAAGTYTGGDMAPAMGQRDSIENRMAALSRMIFGVPNGDQPDTTSGVIPETPFQQDRQPQPEPQQPTSMPQPVGEPRPDALVGPR